ncbi:hypothetical protein [uncultured Roseobacter sp.]|uniref:hypothetical protein n=1 Tax=uncultured Roseobacter sp. TaxID=114847 RepID=UPI002627879B|nr:hypothetical protein [uncultured Roseobacter sp.]
MNLRSGTYTLTAVVLTALLCACAVQRETPATRGTFAGPGEAAGYVTDCSDRTAPSLQVTGGEQDCNVPVMSLLRQPQNVVYTTRAPVVSAEEPPRARSDSKQNTSAQSSSGAKTIPAKVSE